MNHTKTNRLEDNFGEKCSHLFNISLHYKINLHQGMNFNKKIIWQLLKAIDNYKPNYKENFPSKPTTKVKLNN